MKYIALTDSGNVRKENQDSFRVEIAGETCCAVLCDGMGGEQAGSTASSLAVSSFMFHASGIADETSSGEDIRRILTEAVSYANVKVYDKSYTDFNCMGMGTTLVGCISTAKHTLVANVGDSRAYHIRKNSIYQITKDHSLMSEMISSGQITPEEAKTHPRRSVITRAVGVEPSVQTDTFEIALNTGDQLLLCSDGLSNLVSEAEIFRQAKSCSSLDDLAQKLMSLAKDRGAPDNVTLVLLER